MIQRKQTSSFVIQHLLLLETLLSLTPSKPRSYHSQSTSYISLFSLLFEFLILIVQFCFVVRVRWKMTEAVRLVDVVICSVSARETLHQKLLIRFIKQVGSIKVIIHVILFLYFLSFVFNCFLRINYKRVWSMSNGNGNGNFFPTLLVVNLGSITHQIPMVYFKEGF